jgi:uncharacterized protein YbbK (DUF523 family)
MEGKSPVILNRKPGLGISACSMKCPVRYNGRGFDLLAHLGREKSDFVWTPVCPECQAGLGVMRDPIHLAGGNGEAVWTGDATVKNRQGRDITAEVKEGSLQSLKVLERAGVKAFVYMDGSPTCGVYRTTLKKQNRGKPPGVFGALLYEKGFFLIPALDMQSPLRWWDWRRRLLAFLWLQEVKIETRADVYSIWYRLKFICQELDNAAARQLGHEIAQWTGRLAAEQAELFRKRISDMLRTPSTTAKMANSLWKNYSHYRKVTGQEIPEIKSPEQLRNITSIAREMLLMERAAAEANIVFGTSPVLYSGRKKRASDQQSESPLLTDE